MLDLLPLLAGRALVLNRGRLLAQGTLEQIFGDAELMERSGLRLPLVAQLFHDLACRHGIEVPRLPLTLADARRQILELLALPSVADGQRNHALDNPITPAEK